MYIKKYLERENTSAIYKDEGVSKGKFTIITLCHPELVEGSLPPFT